MSENVLAIIGGSGLYELPELENMSKTEVGTPFGNPSSPIMSGTIGNTRIMFIARHGEGHRHLPGEVNYRANVFALKKAGATHLVSVCAVGSLREEFKPGHLVIPDQYIDRTKGRDATFFGAGIVGHVMFADPVCPELTAMLHAGAKAMEYDVHKGATLVTMEGPAFSTKAESHLHRQFGADLIGMTSMPEAKLAREAELCYATLALSTDYDCWREEEDSVEVASILEIIRNNVEKARSMVTGLAKNLGHAKRECPCPTALDNAVMTRAGAIPKETKDKLMPIMGRVL